MVIKNKKISITTLGCRVNLFESNQIIEQIREQDGIYTSESNDADIVIINTCSVTNKADSKSLYFINKACKNKKTKLVVVCGCFSQANAKVLTNKKIGIILGTKYKSKVIELIKQWTPSKKITMIENVMKEEKFEITPHCSFKENTRAFIKIQDGCNYMCSYCLIPFIRGKQRSLDHEIILTSINQLINDGYKEIVLTGVNTAGYSDGKYSFFDLLKNINKIEGNFRIRISSLEPFQIDKKIVDLITNNDKFCQFFHLCLQSGNDKTLKSMNRKYTIAQFSSLCKYIKKKNPLVSITTDYIVGFPNETEEDFDVSLKNVNKIKFADMHIFPYSKRTGTAAERIKNIVSDIQKKNRYLKIESLNKTNKNIYLNKFIGKTVQVLFEIPKNSSVQSGHSQYFFTVNVKSTKKLTNQLLDVKIDKNINGQLFGHLI